MIWKTLQHCDSVGSSHVGSCFPLAPSPSLYSLLPPSPPLLSGFPTAPSPWQLEAASFPAPTWPSWELWGWDASSDWDSPGIPTLAPSCTGISEGGLQAPGTLAGLLLARCCRGYTAPAGSSPLPTDPPFPLLPPFLCPSLPNPEASVTAS